MHIAIEGMDGTGKSTVAKLMAKHLGYKTVEKPLHYLFDEEKNDFENYIRIRDKINDMVEDNRVRAWFYGLGNLYLRHKFVSQNIITDRHLASNFFWCGFEDTTEIFDLLVKLVGKPDFTFVIFASEDEVRSRLRTRDINDPDIIKAGRSTECRAKMEMFLKRYEMEYTVIDTTGLTAPQVLKRMLEALPDRCRKVTVAGDEP